MSAEAKSAPSSEIENERNVIDLLLGSALVKGVVALAGLVTVFILTVGWNSYIEDAASQNKDVISAQRGVKALEAEYVQLQSTADSHTAQLRALSDNFATEQQRNAALQAKIFDAITGLGADLQNVDKHLSAVDAHVSDQADQIRELRGNGK